MRPKQRADFTIAIICALTFEAEAVEALFDEIYDRLSRSYGKQPGDVNAYINGRIGEHNIVLCYLPEMGKRSAASMVSNLRFSYPSVQLALVVGICGGAPYLSSSPHSSSSNAQIFLGDVIISDAVIEYDFGKQYPGGFQRKADVRDILGRPNQEIRSFLAGLKTRGTRIEFEDLLSQHLHFIQQSEEARWKHPGSDDILFEASYLHKHYGEYTDEKSSARCCCLSSGSPDAICEDALKKNCRSLKCNEEKIRRRRGDGAEAAKVSVHIGKVASADTVMKSGEHRDTIISKEGVIGFEMEGAGVWDTIPCIIIKGVCDYADSHKSDIWQAYAAATGASAAKTFLEYWRPVQREERINHWIVPFQRNPHFTGRQDEINQIEGFITMPDGPRELAIDGLGGVGKTQVALELAYRMRDRDSELSVFWIPCTSLENIEQAYMSIAQAVGIEDVKSTEAKEQVKKYLSQESAGKWLLIFDNADDTKMWIQDGNSTALKDSLPESNEGHILFTTRNHKLAVDLAGSYVIPIPELNEETGVKFLKKSLIQKDLLKDSDTAIAFLTELTFLPLAITQAVSYINRNRIGLSDYITLLQEQESEMIELLSENFQDKWRYKDVQNPVATTWLISFQQIQHLDKLAADYLSFMACINPRNIPQSLLPEIASKKRRTDALGLLKAYSFISEQAGDSLSLHRLVHLATRNWMRKNHRLTRYISRTADRLYEVYPDSGYKNRKQWREYLPHALSLVGDRKFQKQQDKYFYLIERVGKCLDEDGRYNEAEELFRRTLLISRRKNGDQDLFTLRSMALLGYVYLDQGRLSEAADLNVQVVKGFTQLLGPEHHFTLVAMAYLATTYENQERWKEAEELEMQILEISKQVLGPEHPETLFHTKSLIFTYSNQGRWKEAEKLGKQILETQKQVLGPKHPDTLATMMDLASTYSDQGRRKEAEELKVLVLETAKKVLGTENPRTLVWMSSLAYTWKVLGKVDDALALMRECVQLCTEQLGADHPETLSCSKDLEKWEKTEQLLSKQTERIKVSNDGTFCGAYDHKKNDVARFDESENEEEDNISSEEPGPQQSTPHNPSPLVRTATSNSEEPAQPKSDQLSPGISERPTVVSQRSLSS